MSLLYGIKALQQSASDNRPHILGFNTARTSANDTLLEVWNAATVAGIKSAVDKDGKLYSAAATAGDLLYAVTGGIANVRRFDSLAIGAANTVLTSSGSAPQWSTNLSIGTLTASGLITANGGVTVQSGDTLTLTGATVAGTPTWSSSQAITLSTAAQPNVTSLGTLSTLTTSGTTGLCATSGNLTIGPPAGSRTVWSANVFTGYTALNFASSAGPINMIPAAGYAVILDDNWSFDGDTLTGLETTNLNITPRSGYKIVLDGTIQIDAGVVTGATSITSTAFVGALTGNADTATSATSATTAGTVTSAAQPNITSLGTLTGLTMGGNIALGSNDITGVGTVTATTLAGTLSTAAQPNVTSLGTLTTLTVDNITINGTSIVSSGVLTVESVIFAGSTVSNISSLTATQLTGTLQTAVQPNITSLGTLTSLSASNFQASGSGVGFHGTGATAKQTISGSRGGNAALADLLTKLATIGLITDSTSA